MTKIIFKKKWWRDQLKWVVFAFFPEVHVNPGNIMCYGHFGQHSEASQAFYRACKPCTEKEYAPLKKELETCARYNDLRVVQKWTRYDRERAWFPERFKDEDGLV